MAIGPLNTTFSVVPGVRLASIACGIKQDHTADLVVFEFADGSTSAGVFTQSLFVAAPVLVSKRHLSTASPRYFLINSGNANAATGEEGIADALATCNSLSQLTGTRPETILPFSTGVIGERLQVSNIIDALNESVANLSEDNWLVAARGIMTTDTRPKIGSRRLLINGKSITLTGIAKGAGMIQPNMATMLAYVATDVAASTDTLQKLISAAANKSFNRITVDSDTSTNDSCLLTATGVSGVSIDEDEPARLLFEQALEELCQELAHGIIRDAEGATKFVSVHVKGGKSQAECLAIAYSVANSPLMKTALYASDANWGRIVMAIGKAEVDIDINKLDIFLGEVALMRKGSKDPDYTEEAGSVEMAGEEISIIIDINAGDFEETVWTSDLSHEYVRINAEYRT